MIVIVGLVIVFGAVLGGYVMHHGQLAVLVQPSEFIIIGGAGLGAMVAANPPAVIKAIFAQLLGLIKPNPFGAQAYAELLQVLYEVFQKARKDGLVGLEAHIEAEIGGHEYRGRAVSTDILEASALALVEVINRLERRRALAGQEEAVA